MINIADKSKCCGCEACSQRCPKDCITMVTDSEGFRYPVVDYGNCVDCGLCEKVCPEINVPELLDKTPLPTYAAYCKDEDVRRQSSSGGVFTVIARKCLDDNGVVFGARFDENWGVVHDYTESLDGLEGFRGSKYLQSKIGHSYAKVEKFLKSGRKVLFSGTPCQVAGLKRFIGKEYSNLVTVDFVCHGVPSPKVWVKYLESVLRTKCAAAGKNSEFMSLNEMPFTGISFRDKRLGWKKFGIRLIASPRRGDKNTEFASSVNNEEVYEPFDTNSYMAVFLSNLSLRLSCYSCPVKGFTSGADLTIGDFWGIENIDPTIDDDRGMSVVFVNNPGIMDWVGESDVFMKEESYDEAVRSNPSAVSSVGVPAYRGYFFKMLTKTGSFEKALDSVKSTRLIKRLSRRLWLQFTKVN